jgi:hypothetical protein
MVVVVVHHVEYSHLEQQLESNPKLEVKEK